MKFPTKLFLTIALLIATSISTQASELQIFDGTGSIKFMDVEGSGTESDPYRNIVSASTAASAGANISRAEAQILGDFGDVVSVVDKNKRLFKFGRNDNLGTSFESVSLTGGIEILPSTNLIDSFSSSSGSDTQAIKIEGHTCSGGIPTTFVVQSATLTGQTKAALSTSLCRVTRAYNDDSTDFAGTIYIYQGTSAVIGGVPSDSTKVHAQTDGANNQTLKAATALSSVDYYIITEICGSVNRQNTRSVDFRFQIMRPNKVFRTAAVFSAASASGTHCSSFDPALIVPKSSDIRMIAISSGSGTGVGASFNGYLASIQ